MEANTKRIQYQWSWGTPFVKLTLHIEEGRACAKSGGDDMADKCIIRIAFKIINDTNQLSHACSKWREKAKLAKDWATFNTHFNKAHSG